MKEKYNEEPCSGMNTKCYYELELNGMEINSATNRHIKILQEILL